MLITHPQTRRWKTIDDGLVRNHSGEIPTQIPLIPVFHSSFETHETIVHQLLESPEKLHRTSLFHPSTLSVHLVIQDMHAPKDLYRPRVEFRERKTPGQTEEKWWRAKSLPAYQVGRGFRRQHLWRGETRSNIIPTYCAAVGVLLMFLNLPDRIYTINWRVRRQVRFYWNLIERIWQFEDFINFSVYGFRTLTRNPPRSSCVHQ